MYFLSIYNEAAQQLPFGFHWSSPPSTNKKFSTSTTQWWALLYGITGNKKTKKDVWNVSSGDLRPWHTSYVLHQRAHQVKIIPREENSAGGSTATPQPARQRAPTSGSVLRLGEFKPHPFWWILHDVISQISQQQPVMLLAICKFSPPACPWGGHSETEWHPIGQSRGATAGKNSPSVSSESRALPKQFAGNLSINRLGCLVAFYSTAMSKLNFHTVLSF